jgi:hypothetical protein
MCDRAIRREPATAEDIAEMRRLSEEAVLAGHDEHREELGRFRLAGIGADAVAVAGPSAAMGWKRPGESLTVFPSVLSAANGAAGETSYQGVKR